MYKIIVLFFILAIVACNDVKNKQVSKISNNKATSIILEANCQYYFDLIRKIKYENDTVAFKDLVKISKLNQHDVMGLSYSFAEKNHFPYAFYVIFNKFTTNEDANSYSIEQLSDIDKCFALDKLNKAFIKNDKNAIEVVNLYMKLKLDYFILRNNQIILNPKYIITLH